MIDRDSAPLVSVLMPCFNHERYVVQALQSIADSSYGPIELVFIDDASSDASFAAAQAWISAHRDRFVRVVCLQHEGNRGIPTTLNELVSEATGDFLTFCSSDDLLVAEGIAAQVRHVGEAGVAFLFADAMLIDEEGSLVAKSAIRHFRRNPARLLRRGCLAVDVLLNWEAPWTRIFATAELMRSLGSFDQGLHFEDRDFIVRAILHGSFGLLPQPVYCYRIRLVNRLTPGLDATRMRLDYLRAEAKNCRAATGLVKLILLLNVMAGKVRFNARGEGRRSMIWPVFALLRRILAYGHLAAMR